MEINCSDNYHGISDIVSTVVRHKHTREFQFQTKLICCKAHETCKLIFLFNHCINFCWWHFYWPAIFIYQQIFTRIARLQFCASHMCHLKISQINQFISLNLNATLSSIFTRLATVN